MIAPSVSTCMSLPLGAPPYALSWAFASLLSGVCPTGDDPQNPGVLEIQALVCNNTDGSLAGDFRLSFRNELTNFLSDASTLDDLRVALNELTTIREVCGHGSTAT